MKNYFTSELLVRLEGYQNNNNQNATRIVDLIARSLNFTSEVISNTKTDIAVINTELV